MCGMKSNCSEQFGILLLHANDIEFVGKTIAKDTQNNNSASKYDMLINGGKSSNLLGFN